MPIYSTLAWRVKPRCHRHLVATLERVVNALLPTWLLYLLPARFFLCQRTGVRRASRQRQDTRRPIACIERGVAANNDNLGYTLIGSPTLKR
jgi:hypothetical protein